MSIQRHGRRTNDSFTAMFMPTALGNAAMFLVLLLFVVFQLSLRDANSLWVFLAMGLLALAAVLCLVISFGRYKYVAAAAAAKEDRRRIAAGLPLDPLDENPQS